MKSSGQKYKMGLERRGGARLQRLLHVTLTSVGFIAAAVGIYRTAGG